MVPLRTSNDGQMKKISRAFHTRTRSGSKIGSRFSAHLLAPSASGSRRGQSTILDNKNELGTTRKLENIILTTMPYHCSKKEKSIWLDRGLTIRRQNSSFCRGFNLSRGNLVSKNAPKKKAFQALARPAAQDLARAATRLLSPAR